jgi:hypothetical protein
MLLHLLQGDHDDYFDGKRCNNFLKSIYEELLLGRLARLALSIMFHVMIDRLGENRLRRVSRTKDKISKGRKEQ